jgi:hypothetical protein
MVVVVVVVVVEVVVVVVVVVVEGKGTDDVDLWMNFHLQSVCISAPTHTQTHESHANAYNPHLCFTGAITMYTLYLRQTDRQTDRKGNTHTHRDTHARAHTHTHTHTICTRPVL